MVGAAADSIASFPARRVRAALDRGRKPPEGPLTSAVASRELQAGRFDVAWENGPAGGQLRIRDRATGRTVLESEPGRSFVTAGQGRARVVERRGSVDVNERVLRSFAEATVDSVHPDGAAVVVTGKLEGDRLGYALRFAEDGQGSLRFELRLTGPLAPTTNRAHLRLRSRAEERFFGFGEQFTHAELKGRRVPILVREGGIGRGAEPISTVADVLARARGDWHTTYAPMPSFLTSDGRGMVLEGSDFAEFDLRDPAVVDVGVFGSSMAGRIFSGATPLDLVEQHTAFVGRMPPLPKWLHDGAVLGLQGGSARVRALVAEMKASGTPISAVWLQDWVGRRSTPVGAQLWWSWTPDRSLYPDWEGLVDELRAQGIRVLGYVNPFLVDTSHEPARRNLFAEAAAQGFLVKNRLGQPYLVESTTFPAGLIDVTNPGARKFIKDVIRAELVDKGVAGWMADFGEGLPPDAVLFSGDDAMTFHSRYAEEWARINREVLDEAGLVGESFFFSRSGFTKSPGVSPLMWAGDQTVTWDEHDGLQSALTGLLSSGISGFALNHTDIGGYTSVALPGLRQFRSPELLQRWTELAAFTPVFRTHEGLHPRRNAQIYDTPESKAHFSQMAKLYRGLAPYREQLMKDATEKGHPLVRHLFLHFGDDDVARDLTRQFLLGPDLLVAPVLEPGATRVRAYVPKGSWNDLWTGAPIGDPTRGTWVDVDAPLGRPAAFVRADGDHAATIAAGLAREGFAGASGGSAHPATLTMKDQ